MDIHCNVCGEPWDHDMLHEFNDYEIRKVLFVKLGCGAFEDEDPNCCSKCAPRENILQNKVKAAEAEALQTLSDHPDDWGSMI